jgi:hypothetical protein
MGLLLAGGNCHSLSAPPFHRAGVGFNRLKMYGNANHFPFGLVQAASGGRIIVRDFCATVGRKPR